MIDVYRRPRVAIVATGDELVDIDQIPRGAQIVNSSAYALYGAIVEAGGEPVMLKVARDTRDEVRARLSEALAFDAVLSTGGVSVGQFDHVKGVLDELGLRQLFHGVAQKPGRPLKFGSSTGGRYSDCREIRSRRWSASTCTRARRSSRWAGGASSGLPRVTVRCAADIKVSNNLTEFVRVRLERREGRVVRHARPATRARGF